MLTESNTTLAVNAMPLPLFFLTICRITLIGSIIGFVLEVVGLYIVNRAGCTSHNVKQLLCHVLTMALTITIIQGCRAVHVLTNVDNLPQYTPLNCAWQLSALTAAEKGIGLSMLAIMFERWFVSRRFLQQYESQKTHDQQQQQSLTMTGPKHLAKICLLFTWLWMIVGSLPWFIVAVDQPDSETSVWCRFRFSGNFVLLSPLALTAVIFLVAMLFNEHYARRIQHVADSFAQIGIQQDLNTRVFLRQSQTLAKALRTGFRLITGFLVIMVISLALVARFDTTAEHEEHGFLMSMCMQLTFLWFDSIVLPSSIVFNVEQVRVWLKHHVCCAVNNGAKQIAPEAYSDDLNPVAKRYFNNLVDQWNTAWAVKTDPQQTMARIANKNIVAEENEIQGTSQL